MKMVSMLLLVLTTSLAQAAGITPAPARQTYILQNGTNGLTVFDGTKPFTITPNPDGSLTASQEGKPDKRFVNSNKLTVSYKGQWPKCGPKPPDAFRDILCQDGVHTWRQTQTWLPHDPQIPPDQCWDIQPWAPTSPPAGACPVVVNIPPVANFAFSLNGLQVNFIDTSTDADGTIVSRLWNFGDGGTSTATAPAHAYAANGAYNVSLTVTDNGGATNTKTQLVTVGTLPTPGLVLDLSYVNMSSPEYTRFKQYVDSAVANPNNLPYNFSVVDAAYMYKLTGQAQYATLAITLVDQQVSRAEAAIASGSNPSVAGDSYLGVGGMLSEVAFTYSWMNDRLSATQKTRWKAYADQTIFNVWHPTQASWGGRPASWSGWSTQNPANNYFYSFMRATECWALASGDSTLMNYLRTDRFPLLVNWASTIPGGGSLEGTGYGVSHKDLFELYQVWKDSGQADLANANSHLTMSGLVWLHATVPTLDMFAPIGDQSRVSVPTIYDYQRTLGLQVEKQTENLAVESDVAWWLRHINDQTMQSSFNYRYNLIPVAAAPALPSSLYYRAAETGMIFTRTSWETTATWMAALFGTYSESHAHQEQGGFTLYRNGWITVTNNIWSHSGINQWTLDKNVVRFEKSGAVQGQQMNRSAQVTNFTPGAGGDLHMVGNLTPFYSSGSGVQSWVRTLDFVAGKLTVNDDMVLASGTTGTFQLNVPTQPTVNGNVVTTARLKMTVLAPVNAQISLVDARTFNNPATGAGDYQSGWRIDVKGSSTNYKVLLEPQ